VGFEYDFEKMNERYERIIKERGFLHLIALIWSDYTRYLQATICGNFFHPVYLTFIDYQMEKENSIGNTDFLENLF